MQSIVHRYQERVAAGRFQEALAEVLPLSQQHPNDFNLKLLAAACHFELGQMREAAVLFGDCHALEPKEIQPLYYGGIAMRKLGMLNESVAAMNMVLKLDPTDFLAAGHRGLALLSLGRHDEARPDLRRFLVRMSERSENLLGKERAAVEEARNGLKAIGEDFPVPGPDEIAMILMLEQGREAELASSLARPATAWQGYFLGDALNCLGRPQEAVAALDQALRWNPLMLDVYRVRGDAYNRFDPSRGLEDYKRYLAEVDPNAGLVWCNLGVCLRNLKRYEEGVEALRRGLDLLGSNARPIHWENLGICQLNTKDFEGCVASMTVALAGDPGRRSPEVPYYRACAQDELGQVEKAIADFQLYLQSGGQVPYASQRLAELQATRKPAPEPKKGLLSKLFGGKKERPKQEKPSSFPSLPFWQDAVTLKLKASASQGRWQEIQSVLQSVHGETRGFYVIQLSEALKGRPGWIDEWLRQSPDSAVAWLFSGKNAIQWAWEGRGTDWGENVKEHQWQLFRERMQMAAEHSMAAQRLDPEDPNPLVQMITYNMGLSGPLNDAWRFFEEAVARCPGHRGAYRSMMYRLAPKWGGSREALLDFQEDTLRGLPDGSPLLAVHTWVLAEIMIGDREQKMLTSEAVGRLVELYQRGPASPRYVESLFTVWDSNHWAWALWWAEQFALANREFKRLGDRVTEWPWTYLGPADQIYQHARWGCASRS